MLGGLNPERAKDLQDRRRRYERRARSIRYGSHRPGSCRHLLQAQWRTVCGLRHPGRALLVIASVGALIAAAIGLGVTGWVLGLVGGAAVVGVLLLVGVVTWLQERFRPRAASPAFPLSERRPHRPAPQDSSRPPAP